MGEFAQTVTDLASSDLGKSLSHSPGALAVLERKVQETVSAQVRADQASRLSTADEYACLVNTVRVNHSAFSITDVFAPTLTWLKLLKRWHLAHACECIMHGRMRMRNWSALDKRTNGTELKARLRLTTSDIHIRRLAKRFLLYEKTKQKNSTHCTDVGGTMDTGREARI